MRRILLRSQSKGAHWRTREIARLPSNTDRVREKMSEMLVHIVCWKYKAETSEQTHERHRAALRALPSVIPDIESFEVGADILHLERSFDTALVAHFHDLDGLQRYTDHPEHQAVAAMGKEISGQVVSVDFTSES